MTRHINRLWNYGVKGLLGTLVILFIFPIVCIVASFGSLIIALSAFIWLVKTVDSSKTKLDSIMEFGK